MASLSTQWASAAYQSVVVHRRDGSALQIGLDRAVTAKISDGALVFTSSLGYVSLPADEVWHWAFSTAEAPGDSTGGSWLLRLLPPTAHACSTRRRCLAAYTC